MALDMEPKEEWQAFTFICDCDQDCGELHQLVREVDEEKLVDIGYGQVDHDFFKSLNVEDIVRVAQLEMQQQEEITGCTSTNADTGAHDNGKKKKQKKYRQPKKHTQQPWPLGLIRSKVRTNPRSGEREVKLSFLISTGNEPELFQSDLDSLFY